MAGPDHWGDALVRRVHQQSWRPAVEQSRHVAYAAPAHQRDQAPNCGDLHPVLCGRVRGLLEPSTFTPLPARAVPCALLLLLLLLYIHRDSHTTLPSALRWQNFYARVPLETGEHHSAPACMSITSVVMQTTGECVA